MLIGFRSTQKHHFQRHPRASNIALTKHEHDLPVPGCKLGFNGLLENSFKREQKKETFKESKQASKMLGVIVKNGISRQNLSLFSLVGISGPKKIFSSPPPSPQTSPGALPPPAPPPRNPPPSLYFFLKPASPATSSNASSLSPAPEQLSVPKNRNRRKIAAFSNRKVLNRRVLPQKSQKNRQKIAEEIAEKSLAIFWAAEKKSQRFRVFKSQRFRDAKQNRKK